MAAVEKGEVYVFGIDTGVVANAVLTSINFDSQYANTNEVQNELGQVVSTRWDDIQVTGSATMQFTASNDRDLEDTFDTFTYDSVNYYITEITKSYTNNGYAEMTFNFESIDFTQNLADHIV